MNIEVPHNYKPRKYQQKFWTEMDRKGYKRAVLVWHRRAGKDKTVINYMIRQAMYKVGTYFYVFPTYEQGRKIIWQGMDKAGFKFLDHIPVELRKRIDNPNMLVELVNGSNIQIIGSDNIDSIVGTNPIGCIFSEYALQDPNSWSFISPILAENGGWAVFVFTPRGDNHGKDIFELAESDPNWFCQRLSVDDTRSIPKPVLQQERNEIIVRTGNDALYKQEYECSFDAPILGAYYAPQLMQAKDQGRITTVNYAPEIPVHTAWDLGMGDSTAIWFFQYNGNEYRFIDYYENQGEGLQHYVHILKEKEYVYGQHIAPHDIEVREMGTGKSRKEVALSLGLPFVVAPRLPREDGIEQTRNLLHRCWFDKEKTKRGVSALRQYRKRYDDKAKTYSRTPQHDWTSHGADAFRTFATGFTDIQEGERSDFTPWRIGG